MSILENIKAHRDECVNGSELLSIEVKEWGATIYFKPVMAMNGYQYTKYLEAAQKATYESMIDLIMLRALDETGKRMFKPSDKKDLMYNAYNDTVVEVISKMGDLDSQSSEAVKK